jgi:hypothetical protein
MAEAMAAKRAGDESIDLTQLAWKLLERNTGLQGFIKHKESMASLDHWEMPPNVRSVDPKKKKKNNNKKKKNKKKHKKTQTEEGDDEA